MRSDAQSCGLRVRCGCWRFFTNERLGDIPGRLQSALSIARRREEDMEAGPVRHVAIAIAALLLAGACTPLPLPQRTASHGSSASPATSSPVDDVLLRRARAILAGSESGFLADVDTGRVTLLAHERMVFANLHQLTF